MQDAFGNPVGSSSMAAVRAYDRAVDAYLHAFPGVLEATEEALAHDPGLAAAHALRGLFFGMYSRGTDARASLACARECSTHASDRERAHVELVGAIIEGRGREALALVEQHTDRYPTDIVAVAPALGAYGLFAFSGRRDHDAARLAFVERLAPFYSEEFPWLLAHRGWCRIECGAVGEGLPMVLESIKRRPANGHNAHMVLHGYYENGDHEAAQAFIAGWLPSYPEEALLWGHLQWHWAIAELALGQEDLALARLLGPILHHLPRGAPYMGLPDTVSLLWRLGLRGIHHTTAWGTAREHTHRYFPNGTNTFGEVHLAMLAVAYRDRAGLEACESRLQAIARTGHAGAAAAVRWAAGLKALLDGNAAKAADELDACCAELPRLGGSHAQRSIVEETRAAPHLPSAEQVR